LFDTHAKLKGQREDGDGGVMMAGVRKQATHGTNYNYHASKEMKKVEEKICMFGSSVIVVGFVCAFRLILYFTTTVD